MTSEPIINGLKLFETTYDVGMPQGMDGATAVKAFSNGLIACQLAESAVVNVYKTNNPAVYADLRSVPPQHRVRQPQDQTENPLADCVG